MDSEDYEYGFTELLGQRSYAGTVESKIQRIYKDPIDQFFESFKELAGKTTTDGDILDKKLYSIPNGILIRRNVRLTVIALVFLTGGYPFDKKGLKMFKEKNGVLMKECEYPNDIEIVRYIKFFDRLLSPKD